ncbi:glycosyltransferase [Pseudarthrobacter sp. BRE9]|uniref:glycosyltransferase n=1 Tax=Pseudarthrobacter sp. BRE9 TaxID=2962582 RepID=UPI0028818B75|nr:glycosyltransferase [Pseudarthrobacter sp. BRE9]MDT0168125.1 glycosyltransferase [Pseudarthrobacter sp. BRE9]
MSKEFHIFVGGSSDRDEVLMSRLEREVLQAESGVRLTLAVGGEPGLTEVNGNAVHRPGLLSQAEFGELLSTASVAFIPIRNGIRAAGHMVMVGALECGIPVLISPAQGVREYILGPAIDALTVEGDILPQLRTLAADPRNGSAQVKTFWQDVYSLEAYTRRVAHVLADF